MKSGKAFFLGIDVGTTSVKAGLVDEDGLGLFQVSEEYPTYALGDGRVEQSAMDWWAAATAAVGRVTARYAKEARCIQGISISSQAPTLLGIDVSGNPVGRGLIWMDQRADAICRETLSPYRDDIHEYSGNRLNPYFVLPKLLWHKQYRPKEYEATWKYLQINGWLVYRLTGICSIDISSAALTQTLDIHTLQTESRIFSLLDLDLSKWPKVYDCDEIVGTVRPDMAALWGIPPHVPVLAGCIDGASSPLGLGVSHPGDIFEMSGQSSGIGVILDHPSFHPNLCLLKHAVPDVWLRKGSMSCSGGALKWFRDNVDGSSNRDFSAYSQMAETSVPGAHGVLFLPYLCGERAPLWDSSLRGIYFGLGANTTRADMVRAIMEGTAYALRTILDEFNDPSLHDKILMGTGGGYKSQIWSQLKSNILNCSIRVEQTSFDAALTGNAFLAMKALGYPMCSSPLADGPARIYTPDYETRDFYEERYRFYRKLFEANRPLFTENEV